MEQDEKFVGVREEEEAEKVQIKEFKTGKIKRGVEEMERKQKSEQREV